MAGRIRAWLNRKPRQYRHDALVLKGGKEPPNPPPPPTAVSVIPPPPKTSGR